MPERHFCPIVFPEDNDVVFVGVWIRDLMRFLDANQSPLRLKTLKMRQIRQGLEGRRQTFARLPVTTVRLNSEVIIRTQMHRQTNKPETMRSATRRCASQHIATQRLSRWGSPAACARWWGPAHRRRRLEGR
jgi:hypothetical protein